MIGLFIGVALPEAARDRLAGSSGGVPGARWIAPEVTYPLSEIS